MRLIVEKTYTFDEVQERRRLEDGHRGEGLDRQLAILDAFVALDFKRACELYSALPYDEEEECPEQEYVGLYLEDLVEELGTDSGPARAQRVRWSHLCVDKVTVRGTEEGT